MSCAPTLNWSLGSSVYFGAFVSLREPQAYSVVTGATNKIKVTCVAGFWAVGDRIVLCTSECVTLNNQCLTVTAIDTTANTVTLSAALETKNTQGYAFRPANMGGFRLELEVGEDCRDMLGAGAVNAGSDLLAVRGSFQIPAGTLIELPGSIDEAKVLSSRATTNNTGTYTVIQINSPAQATVLQEQSNYVRVIKSREMVWSGASNGACGFAWVQSGPLRGYARGSILPGRLRLARGWDYAKYNQRSNCKIDPRIGTDWAIDLWCGDVCVC
jgi:hypothetical protein